MEKLENIINRKISHRQFAQRNLDVPQSDIEESSGHESESNYYTEIFYNQLKDNMEEAIDVSYQNGQGVLNGSRSKVFIKKVLRKLIKVFFGWYVSPIYDSQNTYNGKMINVVSSLRNIILEDRTLIDKLFNLSDNLEQRLADLEQKAVDLEQKAVDLEQKAFDLEQKSDDLEQRSADLEQKALNLEQKSVDLEQKSAALERNLRNENYNYETQLKNLYDKYDTQLDYLSFKVYQNLNYSTKNHEYPKECENSLCVEPEQRNQSSYDKIDYFDFENHFRGSRSAIKKNQEIYIKYFVDKENIIDIGCGRGEFLELLKENSIQATGVDLYREYVDYCVFKGFSAIEADAIKYLSHLDDDIVGGLFCSQVVEHLDFDKIISLCNLAYKKLKAGSYLVIETPNPTSLSMYTGCFYIDPSHVKPIHPLTLEYFLKKAGFKEIHIVYTENSKPDINIPRICVQGSENMDEFNCIMEYVSNMLFGSQDYAIIAKK